MSKFTLFLIHGIGVHTDADWADEAIEMLGKAWQRDVGIEEPIDQKIDIVPISYDEVFEDYLDDFTDLSRAVFADALDLSEQEKQKLSNTLTQSGVKERHFVWAYIVDVILYKMSIVREQVTALVAQQLYDRISQGDTQDNFGIIAHSLGTRVINDTLQRVRTAKVDQGNFYEQGYRIKFLMQVSDVTDLFGLPLGHDKFPPNDVFAPQTYDYLRTISNRFDPIARMVPFRLNHWPEGRDKESCMGRAVYKDIVLDHVHETNVHGLTHHMLHPEVTDEIFELCGYGRMLTEREKRLGAFPSLGPNVQQSLRSALQSFTADAAASADSSWQTYVNLVIKCGDFSDKYTHTDEIDA